MSDSWPLLGELDGDGMVVRETKAAMRSAGLTDADRGTAAAALRLAEAIDQIDGDGLNPGGKLDNVSVPTFLRYMGALGLTPEARKATRPVKEAAGGQVVGFRSRARARRAAAS